jgi:hypothetical protein
MCLRYQVRDPIGWFVFQKDLLGNLNNADVLSEEGRISTPALQSMWNVAVGALTIGTVECVNSIEVTSSRQTALRLTDMHSPVSFEWKPGESHCRLA